MVTGEAIFIVAAYAGVGVGVLALIAWAVTDARRVRARLTRLGERGISRPDGR